MYSKQVSCGKLSGLLDVSRFGPGGRSPCIYYNETWVTPLQFVTLSGIRGARIRYKWRDKIRVIASGETLGDLMQARSLVRCERQCKCELCSTKGHKDAFDDSDSGISSHSETYDYVMMVHQAICSLVKGNPREAVDSCSNLNILLYTIQKFKITEDIQAIHSKVKSAIEMLVQQGIVREVNNDAGQKITGGAATRRRKCGSSPSSRLTRGKRKYRPTKKEPLATTKKANKGAEATPDSSKVKKRSSSKKPAPTATKYRLSSDLALLCGRKLLTREEVLQRVRQYIRCQKLQVPDSKTQIRCDVRLQAITRKKLIHKNELDTFLDHNLSPLASSSNSS